MEVIASILLLAAAATTPVASPTATPAGPTVRPLLLLPSNGLRSGVPQTAVVAAVDGSGVLVPDPSLGNPVVSARAATVATPAVLAPGLWTVSLTPGDVQELSFEVSLGGAVGAGKVPVKNAADAVLALAVSPEEVEAGKNPTVVATVRVTDLDQQPLDGSPPLIEITGGSVGSLEHQGPGVWSAKVKLPEKRFPQAILLAATLPGKEATPALARLLLRGRFDWSTSGTKPHTKLTVRIGRKSWSLTADKYGDVKAELEASPAETTMEVEGVDELGNRNTRSFPLNIPTYNRIWAHLESLPAWIDGKTRLRLETAALDRKGSPVKEGISASLEGTPVPLSQEGEAWTGVGAFSLPPGAHPLTISVGEDHKTLPVTATAAPAVSIRLTANPDSVSSRGSPTAISAQLVDAGGNPAGNAGIAWAVEGLALSGAKPGAGSASALVSLVPGAKPGEVWLAAKAEGPGFTIYSRRGLDVQAGPPAKGSLLGEAPRMIADGVSEKELATRFLDAQNYPVSGLKPTARTTVGSVSPVKEAGQGEYRFTLTAPPASSAGTAHVTVEAGDAKVETIVVFLKPPTRTSMAAGAGYATNLGALAGPHVWVEGRRSIGSPDGPWTTILRLGVTQGSLGATLGGVGETFAVSQEVLSLGIRRRLALVSGWGLHATLGVGPGLVQVVQNPPGFQHQTLTVGGRLGLSAEKLLGRGSLLLEAGYAHVGSTDSSAISGELGGVEVTVGYRHGF